MRLSSFANRFTLLVASTLLVMACAESSVTGGSGLILTPTSTNLVAGQATTIRARAGGVDVAALAEWTSRAPRTATVRAGVVTAVAPGDVWVVARYNGEADSLRIQIGFAGLGQATGVRLAALAADEMFTLTGFAIQRTIAVSGTQTFTHSWIQASSRSKIVGSIEAGYSMEGDTVLSIGFPLALAVDTFTVPAGNLAIQDGGLTISGDGTRIAFLSIKESETSFRYLIPVKPGILRITSIQAPAGYSNVAGSVSGTLQFEAATLRASFGVGGAKLEPIGTQTTQVVVQFTSPFYSVLAGTSTITLGGTLVGGTINAMPQVTLGANDVAQFRSIGLVRSTINDPTPLIHDMTVRVTNPSIGTRTLAATDFTLAFGNLQRITPTALSGNITNWTSMTATAPTLTISQYTAPTATQYGMIVGELTTNVSGQGKSGPLTYAFRAAITPKNGPPF